MNPCSRDLEVKESWKEAPWDWVGGGWEMLLSSTLKAMKQVTQSGQWIWKCGQPSWTALVKWSSCEHPSEWAQFLQSLEGFLWLFQSEQQHCLKRLEAQWQSWYGLTVYATHCVCISHRLPTEEIHLCMHQEMEIRACNPGCLQGPWRRAAWSRQFEAKPSKTWSPKVNNINKYLKKISYKKKGLGV